MEPLSTREQIIEAADQLFYRKGFEHTSFADIAHAVQISRGNFYYHFKSKDEILDAVIDLRLANTQKILNQWEAEGETPVERISRFINILITNKAKIKMYGCPVGTLCAELAKLDHVAEGKAKELFTLFRRWLRKQFQCLVGKKDADSLALHVLAWSQGVASLTNAFGEEKFIHNEVTQMCEWLKQYEENPSQAGS